MKKIFKENDRVKLAFQGEPGVIHKIENGKMHILWDDEMYDDELEPWDIDLTLKRRTEYNSDGFEASLATRLIYHEDEEPNLNLRVFIMPHIESKAAYLIIKFPENSTHIHNSRHCISFKNEEEFEHISKDSNGFYHAFIMMGIGYMIKDELTLEDFLNLTIEPAILKQINTNFQKSEFVKIWKLGYGSSFQDFHESDLEHKNYL